MHERDQPLQGVLVALAPLQQQRGDVRLVVGDDEILVLSADASVRHRFPLLVQERKIMALRALTGVVVLLFAQVLAGCDGSNPIRSPVAPTQPAPPAAPVPPVTLRAFVESSSGFSTTDLRDADDQVIQLNTAGELIWTPDGTRLKGYTVLTLQGSHGAVYLIEGDICVGCYAFEVRFGTSGGERRAYLTIDYNHDNPGTLANLEVASGKLVVTATDVFAPGSYTLSGAVTEVVDGRDVPVAGVSVNRSTMLGWQAARTDESGVYTLRGMYISSDEVAVAADGYQQFNQAVPITGDTRFDIRLVRQ
jgi:hypothetical protein